MRILIGLATVLAVATQLPALQAFLYQIQGTPVFSMTHPRGWAVIGERDSELAARPDGADPMPLLVTSRPRAGQLWYGTWMVDKIDDFDEAEHYLRSLTEHVFDDGKIGTFETGVHNGMEFRYYDGTAVYLRPDGTGTTRENVDFFAAFFKPSDHGVGIALYVGLPSATAQYRELLTRSLQSIRPLIPATRSDQ